MKLANDLLYMGAGAIVILFALFNAVRDMVEFDRFALLPLYIFFVILGVGMIEVRIDERNQEN